MHIRIRHSIGVTLIETVTLAGLLVSTALALSLAPILTARSSGAATYLQRLISSIRELQLRATLEQVPCTLSIHMSSYALSCESSDQSIVEAPTGTRLDRVAPPINIVFHPRGTITPTTLHIQDDRMRCSLTVALRGRVREACI